MRKVLINQKMSEAGVVKSITVKNFMNHQHHTIEFSPQLNFLVGHNGSEHKKSGQR